MTMIGVLGQRWRAAVTPCGDVELPDGSIVSWVVAADDRWHQPQHEPSVRQRRVDGTPVVETKLRIPGGDAIQLVWSTADRGGMTCIEVRNGSPLPIAVAFNRSDLWLPRPPANVPIQGIDLPAGSVVLPVGHAASVTVGIAHGGHTPPSGGVVPQPAAVVRGWRSLAERASRLVLPDVGAVDACVAARCDLALGVADIASDADSLVAAGELARMGLSDHVDMVDVAHHVERILRRGERDWCVTTALRGARIALDAAGEHRALGDLARATAGWAPPEPPTTVPTGMMTVPWLEHCLVADHGVLLPEGYRPEWLGAALEAHGVVAGSGRVSFGMRWHGARPAVLWEVHGGPLTLTAPAVAPGWSTSAATGETLWPAPEVR